MKIIVVLDDNNGMMFNHRRQSQDKVLRKKIVGISQGSLLWVNEYTNGQFTNMNANIRVDEDFLHKAGKGEYCFVENVGIVGVAEYIEEIIIFRWNRNYPSDFQLDLFPKQCGFVCTYSEEFVGNSHDKITMEIWGVL